MAVALAGSGTALDDHARRIVAVLVPSVAVWFIADTAYSLSSGFWQNAVLNTLVLVVFAVPLAATRRWQCP
jgi:uncharacterized membrane protein YqaE (UPF0057 family)